MAEAAVTLLLQSLADQWSLFKAADAELEKLQDALQVISKELKKAAENESGEEFQDLESKILQVVYEAEDLIDSYIIQEHQHTKERKLPTGRIDLASQMKQLREGDLEKVLQETKARLASLPPTPPHESRRWKKRKDYDPLIETEVVGMRDEIEKYVEDLLKPCEGVEALSIVGMPGLGKTTIASTVFRDERINHHFPSRVWINVSKYHNKRDIYLTIIKSFTKRNMSNLKDPELALKAKEHLSQVKFLLVFDDVWTKEAWDDIKLALPSAAYGTGKVLITTRFSNVAGHASPTQEPNYLRVLDDEECWKLLQLHVYGIENMWPDDLVYIGKRICRKSGGLPLAIEVIGGILLDKIHPMEKLKDEWKTVADRAEVFMMKKGDENQASNLSSIIGLSYDTMPYHLKKCFLYLGIICPRDFQMSSWKLKRLWITEGFIKAEEGSSTQDLEAVAEENLKELIRRNLVMVGKKNDQGDVKTCHVHDMILEFCKEFCKNLLTLITKTDRDNFDPEVSELKHRRICVRSHVVDFLKEKTSAAKLRSFISFSKTVADADADILQSIGNAFKRIFEGCSMKFSRSEPKLNAKPPEAKAGPSRKKTGGRPRKRNRVSKAESEEESEAKPEESSKNEIAVGTRKTNRAAKVDKETEYFEEKRNLEDLWKQAFPVGLEWDQMDKVYQYNWNFSNLENAFEEGGELCNKKVYLFGCTEAEMVPFRGETIFVMFPVVVAVVSPFPPSDKIGVTSVQCETEEIIPMKEMKMDWVPYIPLEQRVSQVERLRKSQIFILSCTQRRAGLRHLKAERVKKFEYCIPYFYHPLQEDELEQSTEVEILFPIDPPLVTSFDWELDELQEFVDKFIEDETLPADQKEAFKDFIKQKVCEAKKANREAREARKKAQDEMSAETKAAYENMRFYKFYPVNSPDTPDLSAKKSSFINRYYRKAHKIL